MLIWGNVPIMMGTNRSIGWWNTCSYLHRDQHLRKLQGTLLGEKPLVTAAMNDEEIDLCGIIFVGSPQVNSEKFYVSKETWNDC